MEGCEKVGIEINKLTGGRVVNFKEVADEKGGKIAWEILRRIEKLRKRSNVSKV